MRISDCGRHTAHRSACADLVLEQTGDLVTTAYSGYYTTVNHNGTTNTCGVLPQPQVVAVLPLCLIGTGN